MASEAPTVPSKKRPPRVYFEIDESQLAKMQLGSEQTFEVRGKVVSADVGEPPEKDDKGKVVWEGRGPEVRIEVSSLTVMDSTESEFSKLAED